MPVIPIAPKQGTSKTSPSITFTAGLARRGKNVLLIDIDRQALPIHLPTIPNLEVVPSLILLSHTEIELTTAKDPREERLKNSLHRSQINTIASS